MPSSSQHYMAPWQRNMLLSLTALTFLMAANMGYQLFVEQNPQGRPLLWFICSLAVTCFFGQWLLDPPENNGFYRKLFSVLSIVSLVLAIAVGYGLSLREMVPGAVTAVLGLGLLTVIFGSMASSK